MIMRLGILISRPLTGGGPLIMGLHYTPPTQGLLGVDVRVHRHGVAVNVDERPAGRNPGIMEKKMETTIMESQMEKKMENEMETGIIIWCLRKTGSRVDPCSNPSILR